VVRLEAPTRAVGDRFGAAVALTARHALVGAPGDLGGRGAVHVFDAQSGAFLRTLTPSLRVAGAQFGFSVAVEGDVLLAGAPFDEVSGVGVTGKMYVFSVGSGELSREINGQAGSELGFSVAISGGVMLSGMPGLFSSGVQQRRPVAVHSAGCAGA
jgi:hypothetical protein